MATAVKGQQALRRRLAKVPKKVRKAIKAELERSANELVREMKALVPVGETGALRDSIGWTWGDAPAGSMKIGTFRSKEYGKISVTIYAGNEDAFYAHFVEFGTRPHSVAENASVDRGLRQDKGVMHPGAAAKPFFYPVYRANKRRLKGRLTRAINKAMKDA